MAIKRALVVDDSKSARLALKKLLEQQQLTVSLAESGEDALEFLKRDLVDVIFMDHTMPGMDGLEAVTAIKANPRTATIPVMMYTTKEGEVYVGQARALGAVGVLPKNVQSNQLFDMLQKLGLVKDRRAAPRPAPPVEPEASRQSPPDIDRELDQQAMGMSVQALVTRILEDQHTGLRSDILRSQTSFAKEVAAEVIREHDRRLVEQEQAEALRAQETESIRESRPNLWAIAASTLLLAATLLGWQFKQQRDDLLVQVASLEGEQVRAQLDQVENSEVDSAARILAAQEDREQMRSAAVRALAWAANQSTHHAFTEAPFNEPLADKVSEFVAELREIGFEGQIQLTSHLGEFCLQKDDFGDLRLADPDAQIAECVELGHPLATSSYVSDRLTVAFAQLLRAEEGGGIEFKLVALDLDSSIPVKDYPDSNASASVWNAVAMRNNRVEIDVIE